jgi:MFS family permease
MDKSQNMDIWQEYFNHPKGSNLGRLQAMYAIGSISSLPIAPFVADRWGRKASIVLGCSIMIIASALQTGATGQPMFEGARFFLGFGNSFSQLASPLLLTEICHPQHRARVTAVYNCLWHVGHILCAWLTFGTKEIPNQWCWRSATLIQAIFSLIQITFIWWVPESPRWLISKDRSDEALAMLTKYHADGDSTNPILQFEYEEIKETLRLEFLHKKTSSYLEFFKTAGNRHRLAILFTLGESTDALVL